MLRRIAVDHRLATMECRLAQVEDGLAQLAEAIATPEPFYAEDREMIGFKPKAKKNVEENRK